MPAGAAGISKIFKSIAITTFIYLGPELIAFVYPNVRDKNHAIKWVTIANIVTTFFYTSVCLISIALFGETMLSNLKLSLFDVTRVHQIGMVQQIDFVFLILWFPFLESALRIYFFTAYTTFNNVLNLKRKGWLYLLFIAFIILLSLIPRNFNQLFDYSKVLSYWGGGVILLLFIYYILSFMIKRGIEQR
jgi:hypothetical protein